MNEEDNTAALIELKHAIVVDEVSTMDRCALETADRTFQRLRGSEKPFGGITMVFSVNWRQILTVVPHGSRIEMVGRWLKSSYLWRDVKVIRLTENMKIRQATGGQQDEAEFATFLLNIGEGMIPVIPEEGEFAIDLNTSLTLPGERIEDIISWVYEDLQANNANTEWLCGRVILCPTNSEVDNVNEYMTKMFPREEHVCSSVDTAESAGDFVYPTEVLHTLPLWYASPSHHSKAGNGHHAITELRPAKLTLQWVNISHQSDPSLSVGGYVCRLVSKLDAHSSFHASP